PHPPGDAGRRSAAAGRERRPAARRGEEDLTLARPATLAAAATETDVTSRWTTGADPGLEQPPSLFRNGYALIASSAVTSLLGMVFWVVAARRYSPRDVGLNSAA